MSCGKTASILGNFGKNKNDNNKLECVYCKSFRLLSKKKEHINSLRQSSKQILRACLNFPTKNIIRSFLCFLPVFFPVFTRQIAWLSYSEEILKPDPSKIQTACKALKALHN